MGRIGIYGGTFNPPHMGHVAGAKQAIALLKLDRLLLIPAREPPHKALPSDAPSPQQRLELVRLMAREIPGLRTRAFPGGTKLYIRHAGCSAQVLQGG